jgi:hypothetical protein
MDQNSTLPVYTKARKGATAERFSASPFSGFAPKKGVALKGAIELSFT